MVLLLALLCIQAVDSNVLRGKNPISRGINENQDLNISEHLSGPVQNPGTGESLPPKCPADESENSPYMVSQDVPDYGHLVKKYYSPVTNLERINSIRGLLDQTRRHLDQLHVPYALYGGSALGQRRCRDVLPWDADCDVIVWNKDVHKFHQRDFHLDSRYAMLKGNKFIPFTMVDKTTGLYCDVFIMNHDEKTQKVWSPWPWGNKDCSWTGDPFWRGQRLMRWDGSCYAFDAAIVTPFAPCVLHGTSHTCFKNQEAYLENFYGTSWMQPNVSTQLLRNLAPIRQN